MNEIGRRNPATGVTIQLGQPNTVLLTVTTEDRDPWLANSIAHRQEATAWLVGDYVLMPDHLHAFCVPKDLSFTIERWITYLEARFPKAAREAEWKFQPRGWHHRLREGKSYAQKWVYVQENPVRAGLANRIEDWPFKGNVHLIYGHAQS